MKRIIILGSNGKVGKRINDYLSIKNKVFNDRNLLIKELINFDFISKNKIQCIINCIGSHKSSGHFYLSNFIIPAYISKELSKLNNLLEYKLRVIHFSSIGSNAPYSKLNFNELKININQRRKLDFNLYEFSKFTGDFLLKNNLNNSLNIETIIIKPSNIIFENSHFLRKLKLFIYLFPIYIDGKEEIAITRIDSILFLLEKVINKKYTQKNISVKKLFTKEKISDLIKNYELISFFKIRVPKSFIISIINLLPSKNTLSGLKRILIYIFLLK